MRNLGSGKRVLPFREKYDPFALPLHVSQDLGMGTAVFRPVRARAEQKYVRSVNIEAPRA